MHPTTVVTLTVVTLHDTIDAFKAARLLMSSKITEMNPGAVKVEDLKGFPHFNNRTLISNLKAEHPVYLAKVAGISSEKDPSIWWNNCSTYLPYWSAAAKNVILVQPSSATADRAFSDLVLLYL